MFVGNNLTSLRDISGLEKVSFTEDAAASIELGTMSNLIKLSDISNLDDSVSTLILQGPARYADTMSVDGNTCTRISEGLLSLEDTNGTALEYSDYCG